MAGLKSSVKKDRDEDKIRAVKDWPRPRNLHKLRSFLGLYTYNRCFVPNFASVAASVHELTNKSKVYQWDESQEKVFQTLKDLLCTAPVLKYPVPGEKFTSYRDASGYGNGGVLSQVVNGT